MAKKKHGYDPAEDEAPADVGAVWGESPPAPEVEVVQVVAGGQTYLLARGTVVMTPTVDDPKASTGVDSLLPGMIVVDEASKEKQTVSDVCLVTGRATGGLSVWAGPLR